MCIRDSNKAALTLNINPHSTVVGSLTVGMNCEGEGDMPGSCSAQLDISEQVNALEQNTWSSLSIDLQCFVNAGIDFTGLVVPFELGSSGKASISVADIQFTPQAAENADITCK